MQKDYVDTLKHVTGLKEKESVGGIVLIGQLEIGKSFFL